MIFTQIQKIRFETEHGSYSRVTGREFYDSQITLTDYEFDLVTNYFGINNIQVGNVRSNPTKASKEFFLHPSGIAIRLNVVFPKPHKNELRLYISDSAGFKPKADNIWYMFIKNNNLFIGEMTEQEWRLESSIAKTDETDEIFQKIVNEEIQTTTIKEREIYLRNKSIALDRLSKSNFECEIDRRHKTFISRRSGRNYMEAHHLIPISLQHLFTYSLDSVNNIFCLCPNCHRAVHYANEHYTRKMLSQMIDRRNVLDDYNITKNDLFSYYAAEEI